MLVYSRKLSEVIAEKYSHLIEEQQCYGNSYNLVTADISEFPDKSKLGVAFFYIWGNGYKDGDFRYFRHACCTYEDKIIEPLSYIDMENEAHILIKHFGLSEYLEAVEQDGEDDLPVTLFPFEGEIMKTRGIFNILSVADMARLFRNTQA